MDDIRPTAEPTQQARFLCCTALTVPAEYFEASANTASDVNLQDTAHGATVRAPDDEPDKLKLALSVKKHWPVGTTLTVSFMGPGVPAIVVEKVKEYANIWSQYANIKFAFNAPHPAMIRVSFHPGGGHNSALGTECLQYPKTKHTLNLDPEEINTYVLQSNPARFRQLVLHEFGHAIGCIHEHQRPDYPIDWNKEEIYERLGGDPNYWSKAVVDFNIIDPYDTVTGEGDQVTGTNFDKYSIMEYFFDSWMTKDGLSLPGGTDLSAKDKEFIATIYPFPSALETGVVQYVKQDATRVASAADRFLRSIAVPLSPPRNSEVDAAPTVLLGLNAVNAAHDAALRIECEVAEVIKDSVTINLRSGGDDSQEGAGCAWLKIPQKDTDVQFDRIKFSSQDLGSSYLKPHTAQKVTFGRPYQSIPKVTVWLHAIDCDADFGCNFDLVASDVTTKGFTLHFYSSLFNKLRLLGATWLAHSADRVDIATGSFSTENIPTPALEEPGALNSGVQPFESAKFTRPPKVFLAISRLEVARDGDARVLVSSENITKDEMSWRICSSGSTVLECARVAYVALEPVD